MSTVAETSTETETVTVTETADASVPDVPSTTEEPAATSKKFGGLFTYTDGLVVSVSKPAPFTPSDSAAVGSAKAAAYLAFEITIKNGTSKTFDPTGVQTSLQNGDLESEDVFDSANGIGGSPSTSLVAGRSLKFKVVFGVQNSKDLVFELTPSFDYNPAIFTT